MWLIFIIVVGFLITMSAVLYIFQERFVFFPSKTLLMSPKDIQLEYEDLYLKSRDGRKINAWFIPCKDPRATVLFCHGNAGNLSHRLDTIKLFHDLGVNFLIFDYGAYGNSEGSPSENGSYIDAETAWNYLTNEKKIPKEKIIIAGRSLGGAIASHLAMQKAPVGLILESAFMSIPEMGRDIYPFLPASLLARLKLSTNEYVKAVKCPTLIMHSPEDEVVRYRHGKANFGASAGDPKEFFELRGSHNDGFMITDGYIKKLDEFIKLCLVGKNQQKKD
jgi:alpha-beta hydrolase superfamily lysophospholipase